MDVTYLMINAFFFTLMALASAILSYRVIRALIEYRRSRRCLHPSFRVIAAPFARQCRKCGLIFYHDQGDEPLPDGFYEYMEAVREGGTVGEIMQRYEGKP